MSASPARSLASLPMYDWPELRDAVDGWWTGLARHFRKAGVRDVPDRLERALAPKRQWASPALLFSQTCGYPFTHEFAGRLRLLATPAYDVEGAREAHYSSVIVVRADAGIERLEDLRARTAVYNAPDSLSGHLALRLVFAPLAGNGRFFARALTSGNHAGSMQAVADGRADVAAIDCVSYAIARRYRPALTQPLRVIARSPQVLGLPYVTAQDRDEEDVARLREGLAAAVADQDLSDLREAMFLRGVTMSRAEDYRRVVELERSCGALAITSR